MRRLTAALAALVLAGCSTAPSATVPPSVAPPTSLASAAPTESAGASVEPSPTILPTASPEPTRGVGTLDVLPPGAAVRVTVSELNLRRKPSTSAKRLTTLKRGQIVIVSPSDGFSFGWGPVRANGYTWYPVIGIASKTPGTLDPLPTYPIPLGAELTAGWLAADNGSRPYVEIVAPRCPETIDLTNVQGMLPAERLACFGEPFVLEGTFGCGGCGGTTSGVYKPAWLASPLNFNFLSVNAEDHVGPLALSFPPSGPEPPAAGSIIKVTVHVADSRSSRCQGSDINQDDVRTAVNTESMLLWCREQLVVDSFEVTGTDPAFPM